MLKISEAQKQAWENPARQLAVRVKVDGVLYDSLDISSLSFDSASMAGESFAIGSTYMNSVKIIFPKILESIKENQEVWPELGILVNGKYEYVPLGKFLIDSFDRDRNGNKTTIEANDEMSVLERPYVSKLIYPATVNNVALEIANLAGVEIDEVSFSALRKDKIDKPEGYTFRQAIGLMAQFHAGYATFNRSGKLVIQTLNHVGYEIKPENYLLKGFSKNEKNFRVGGISVKTGDLDEEALTVGSSGGSQIQLENKVMTQPLLQLIWEQVKSIYYYPFDLKWQGNPALEAGDWLYVYDKTGKKYSVPNLGYSLQFNGGLVATSSANTKVVSEINYAYRGALNKRLDSVERALSANGWNSNYYDTTEPKNPKDGDIWYKQNGKDKEMWIYKEVDGKLQWVLETSTAPDPELVAAIEENSKVVEQAKEDAEKAIEKANEATDKANEAHEKAIQAAENADNSKEIAQQAKIDAATAASNALQAKEEAENALKEIDGVKTDLTTQLSRIDGELSAKVSQTDYDSLKGTVNSQGTLITANTNAIGLKANKTDVDTLNSRVTQTESGLSIQAGQITALTTQSDGHTTQISSLQQTSAGLLSSVSQVETDIKNISNRNLIYNSTWNLGKDGWTDYSAAGKVIAAEEDKSSCIFYAPANASGTSHILCRHIFVEKGDVFTLAFDVKTNLFDSTMDASICAIRVYPNKETNTMLQNIHLRTKAYFRDTELNVWKRVSYTFTVAASGFLRVLPHNGNTNVMAVHHYREMSLIKGAVTVADWTAAVEDSATVTQISTIEQTISGIQMTVATKADSSQVTQLSNQITSVVKDVDGHTTQISQMSNQITSVVTQMNTDKVNLVRNADATQSTSNFSVSGADVFGIGNNNGSQPFTENFFYVTRKAENTSTSSYLSQESNATSSHDQYAYRRVARKKWTMSGYYYLQTTGTGYITIYTRVTDANGTLSYFNISVRYNPNQRWERFEYLVDLSSYTSITDIRFAINLSNYKGGNAYLAIPQFEEGTTATAFTTNNMDTATQSQITQLSDQINLRVTQGQVDSTVNASILANNQIKDTRNDNQLPSWYFTNYPKQVAKELKLSTVIGLPSSAGTYAYLETESRWNSTAGGNITQTAKTNDGTYQRRSNGGTAWVAWVKIADSSNVVNQINISTEGILISGNKIQITGQTYIENSVIKTAAIANAAITDAKIGSLSATKITTGTLNAANVNIINMNANNIVTGTISAASSWWNLNTGEMLFTKGNIQNTAGKININLTNSLMYFKGTYFTALSDRGLNVLNSAPTSTNILPTALASTIFLGISGTQPQLAADTTLRIVNYKVLDTGVKTTNAYIDLETTGNVNIRGAGFTVNKGGLTTTSTINAHTTINGDLSVKGSKNAIHVTRDGVRATPAYETAESYLGDIGRSHTDENCEVWVPIEILFSDTVNTDIPYEVFLQSYDDSRVWVADFKTDKFLIKSSEKNVRFAWEIKAKRRGYENDRLKLQNDYDNEAIQYTYKDIEKEST